MSLNENFIHRFNEGEAVCIFNLNVEQDLFSLFVKKHEIISMHQTNMLVTVIYKENVNTKHSNKNANNTHLQK